MRFREEVENPMVLGKFEHNRRVMDWDFDYENEDHEVRCAVCGSLQYKEEAAESQMWEDKWICDEKDCIEKHHIGWAESMRMQKYYKGQTL